MIKGYRAATIVLALCPVLALRSSSQAQTNKPSEPGDLTIVTATVRNKAGNFIMGVPRESFTLTDEKDTRAIELFQTSDDPMSIGLLVDTSASMQFYETRDTARAAAIGATLSHFVELSNPDNEYFVMAFDTAPRVLTTWKTGRELLSEKIDLSEQKKQTSLYDSFVTGLQQFKSARYPRRALVVLTDGLDNSSKSTFAQVREQLKRTDVAVYAFGIGTLVDMGSTLGLEGKGILDELAEITGGEATMIYDKKEMKLAIEALSVQLRHQYRLGFRAPNTGTERWRRLKLKITPRQDAPEEFKKLSVTTRPGYYSK